MNRIGQINSFIFSVVSLLLTAQGVNAQATLSPDVTSKIDKIAADSLADSGVPSASVAVVKDGQIVF